MKLRRHKKQHKIRRFTFTQLVQRAFRKHSARITENVMQLNTLFQRLRDGK